MITIIRYINTFLYISATARARTAFLDHCPSGLPLFLSLPLVTSYFVLIKGPEIRARSRTLPPPRAPLRLKLCENVPPYLRNILSYFQLKRKEQ